MRTLEERVYLAMVAISKASFGDIEPTFEEMKAAIEAADEPQGEHMSNLINCGTCGYPLAPEERTTLVEKDGVMVKPDFQPYWMNYQDGYADGMAQAMAEKPAREWMGLTPSDEEAIYRKVLPYGGGWRNMIREAEAKLKEKNT